MLFIQGRRSINTTTYSVIQLVFSTLCQHILCAPFLCSPFIQTKRHVLVLSVSLILTMSCCRAYVCVLQIIGLTLETRPDLINAREITNFRRYGCTRVQLGIQHTDDHGELIGPPFSFGERFHDTNRDDGAEILRIVLTYSGLTVSDEYSTRIACCYC